MMRTIITVLYIFLFLILGLPVLGIEWIISKFNKAHADMVQLRIVQWGLKCVAFISGVKLTVIGEENVPRDEPVLYIGNHRSFFDVVVTYARCPGLTGYIAKDGVNKVPIFRIWMKRLHCIFLKRDDMKEGLKVILKAIEYVKSGISICIFPEGTRNKDRDNPTSLLPFKEGSFKIASKTGCKIVPMALIGTADILENHFPWIHSTDIKLIYGEPIDVSALDKDQQKHVGAYCQTVVEELIRSNM
ncbi:MAG: lysophospholipid acyltransferase family protein [Lachnobacterium sp.]|nr:lysophospholipid acyltransferase family protein [Lachnobacterium sp.]